MAFINHNDMAESIIKSRGDFKDWPQPFAVRISHIEVQMLKKLQKQSGDSEKYFTFDGHLYKWHVYYKGNSPYINVVPDKDDVSGQGKLEFDAATSQELVRIANILDEKGNHDLSNIIDKLLQLNFG
jgi:hypothetical protein